MVFKIPLAKYFNCHFNVFQKFNDTSITFTISFFDLIISLTANITWFTDADRFRVILFELIQVMMMQDFKVTEYWYHETSLMPQSCYNSWPFFFVYFLFIYLFIFYFYTFF